MFAPDQQSSRTLKAAVLVLVVLLVGALGYYFWPTLRQVSLDLLRGEAAGGVTLTLVPSKTTVAPDETFTVNVLMDTGTNEVAAVELHVSYPALVQGISIQKTAVMTAELVAGVVSSGTASITLGSGTSPIPPGSSIHIATLTLKALHAGTATIEITNNSQIAALNNDGNVLEVRTPAEVTVSGGGGVTMSVATAQTTFTRNDIFTVDIVLDTAGKQVTAADITIAYPAATLQAQTIIAGNFLPNVLTAGAVGGGKATITVGSGTTAKQGTGIVAHVTLKALAAGTAAIAVDQATEVAAVGVATSVLEMRTPTTVTIAEPVASPSPTLAVSPSTVVSPSSVASPSPTPSPTPTPSPQGPTSHQVIIRNFAFTPATVSVRQGDTVTFINQDSVPHTATAVGVFNSGTIAAGQSFVLNTTNLAVGSHPYTCGFHPAMQGTLIVTAASPAPSPTPTVVVTSLSPTPTIAAPPPAQLVCSPTNQTRIVNETTTISASGGTGSYHWSAPGGSPVSGTGGTMGTAFGAPGTYSVSVNSGAQSKSCTVIVQAPSSTLACSPASVNAVIGQPINLNASGATGSVTWSAPGLQPVTTSQHTFTVAFDTPGLHIVTLSNIGQNAECRVTLADLSQASPSTISQVTGPSLVANTAVRNVTTNSSESDAANAVPGNTVEFIVRATNNGTVAVRNVRINTAVPTGFTLVSGSVTVNNIARNDQTLANGSVLGDVIPGQTMTVRFRSILASDSAWRVGTTAVTESATMSADSVSPKTDTAFINVVLGSDASGLTPPLSVKKLGRNVTRGQFGERSVVHALARDTLEFVVRVTSNGTSPISNVIVRDILPSGMEYIPGTTTLNGQKTSDAVPAVGGLLIPSIQPGQEMVLRFNTRVSRSIIPGSALNTVRVTSQGSNEIVAQLPLVFEIVSLTEVGGVQTGVGESVVWALVISAFVTLLYVGYTYTNIFRLRELRGLIKHGRRDGDFGK